jgi:aspartate kinase
MTNYVVMKFGGTSVGSTERIGEVAKKVIRHRKETGERVVVVVSAMSGETDRILELCRKIGGETFSSTSREADQAAAAGEQISCALTALAFQRQGCKAKSLTAYQVPIKTNAVYGQNLISEIERENLIKLLEDDIVPVVAGFQGIDEGNNLRTLGRGGSDNTAVALAAALATKEKPCRCIIYTDIDGVYTALPSIVKQAKKLNHLTYEEMLEFASSGAKVLQTRSVSLAKKFKVPLFVCSSFSNDPGTEIVEEYEGMEDAVVSGITCRTDEAKLTLRNIPDKPGTVAQVCSALAEAGVVIDMIVQSQGQGGKTSISFTVPTESANKSFEVLQGVVNSDWSEASVEIDRNVAKLTIVGEGMRNHAGVAAQTFQVLGKEGINVDMITTSEIKITVAINQKYSELAVRALHEFFIEGKRG